MKKSKRALTLALVVTLAVTLLSGIGIPALAGGGPLPEVLYYDVDTKSYLYAEVPETEWPEDSEKEFVFEAPDGSLVKAKVFRYGLFEIYGFETDLTQTGFYHLTSYYVPKGYEVAGIFCNDMGPEWERNGFTITEENMENFANYISVYIYLKKAGSATGAVTFAMPTTATVLVNDKDIAFDAYNIDGSNYFKLRDLAYVLGGTEKQFAVGWDGEAGVITLTSGKPYTPVGGEMPEYSYGWLNIPSPTDSKIVLNGEAVSFTAYNINGNNYFKLRDMGSALDFGIDWDADSGTIIIDTSKGYVAP